MKKILIIYTGGTIGMIADPISNTLRPSKLDQIVRTIPALSRFQHSLEVMSFDNPIDSSNMTPSIWGKLARIIQTHYHEFDGFVVLHGSDTMAFTASALSFMFDNLAKPVILTGSQLPLGSIRTDAQENLITSIEIATSFNEKNQPIVPEVAIYFGSQLLRGNRTTKFSATEFGAFQSPNYPSLGDVGVHIQFNEDKTLPMPNGNFDINTAMSSDIAVLKMFPGIDQKTVDATLQLPVKGIIMETFGVGNTYSDQWFVDSLQKAIDDGKVIVNRSQCVVGRVTMGTYETSEKLAQIGVTNGFDMTFEASCTKLMHLLANEIDLNQIRTKMSISLRGELSSN